MYDRILSAAVESVWLIDRPKLDAIFTFLESKSRGVSIDAETVQLAIKEGRRERGTRTESLIGVIPVYGTIMHRAGMLEEFSGGVSTDTIGREFDAMMAEPAISTIMLEYDSYGGTYPGIPELADKIYQARSEKRIVSVVNSKAGSGAYWLAAAGSEIVITQSGEAGSIGAFVRFVDASAINEEMGIKPEYISYGQYKTEGNDDEPLTDDARQFLQEKVNRIGKEFETTIAKYRGISTAKVHAEFGRGRMLDAKTAKAAGMVDRIETFNETVRRIATPPKKRVSVQGLKNRLRLS